MLGKQRWRIEAHQHVGAVHLIDGGGKGCARWRRAPPGAAVQACAQQNHLRTRRGGESNLTASTSRAQRESQERALRA